jgi:hypothetical protein
VEFRPDGGHAVPSESREAMTRRPRRNHTPSFKAKVALAAIKGRWLIAGDGGAELAAAGAPYTPATARGMQGQVAAWLSMLDRRSAEPKMREFGIRSHSRQDSGHHNTNAEIHSRRGERTDEDRHRPAAARPPLEADLVNPLPENFHREALSVPLAHATVLMAEYRSANINGALISP